MIVGTVQAIWRYPVKSMRGERLDSAPLGERGLPGDRRFAAIDQSTGKVGSAKHPRLWRRLLECRAETLESAVRIILPDGSAVLAGTPEADDALSALLGRPVRLTETPPESAEIEREYPEVEGHPLAGQFLTGPIGLGTPGRTFFDFAPFHLLTTASLRHLRTRSPEYDFDARRFRPNLVVETVDSLAGFAENQWLGALLAIGDGARLRVTEPAPRCVVPTLAHGALRSDPGVLRAIVRDAQTEVPEFGGTRWPTLGVYTVLERPGVIRVGDPLRLLATGPAANA